MIETPSGDSKFAPRFFVRAVAMEGLEGAEMKRD